MALSESLLTIDKTIDDLLECCIGVITSLNVIFQLFLSAEKIIFLLLISFPMQRGGGWDSKLPRSKEVQGVVNLIGIDKVLLKY